MCRERVPGYKYFIFTDEDVTLKVEKSSKIFVIKLSLKRWTTIRESCGQRVFQATLGEDLKSSSSTSSLGSVSAGIQQIDEETEESEENPPILTWGEFSEGSIF